MSAVDTRCTRALLPVSLTTSCTGSLLALPHLPTAVRRPLQPASTASEESASEQQQQPSAGQPTSGLSSSSKAIASAAAAARSAPAQSQQQDPQDWREQARLRALEALQKAQDEKAAVLKQQQEEEEATRKARRAKVSLPTTCSHCLNLHIGNTGLCYCAMQ
jgi:hypothetical protein